MKCGSFRLDTGEMRRAHAAMTAAPLIEGELHGVVIFRSATSYFGEPIVRALVTEGKAVLDGNLGHRTARLP